MARYQFLSDDWFGVVEQLVSNMGAQAPADADLVMNLVVTDTPFGAERHLHVGARDGVGQWGIGHLDDADLAVTTDYETAREILLSGDPQSGLSAFVNGKVRVQGDLAKLLTTVQEGGAPGASAFAAAIQDVTA